MPTIVAKLARCLRMIRMIAPTVSLGLVALLWLFGAAGWAQPILPTPEQSAPLSPAAQRAILYEEDPATKVGVRFLGSVTWRAITIPPAPGRGSEIVIRCEVEIPERQIKMVMSISRNLDQALPASHLIEMMFVLPSNFEMGNVANVPGVLMKSAEQARGAPLVGTAAKVTNDLYIIGLSPAADDLERNLQLLKEGRWLDVPIVYSNGRRSVLALEKGAPGEGVFNEAFTAWEQ